MYGVTEAPGLGLTLGWLCDQGLSLLTCEMGLS